MKSNKYDEPNITKTVTVASAPQPWSCVTTKQSLVGFKASATVTAPAGRHFAKKKICSSFFGESDKTLRSFTADPLTLSVSACLGLHLTLKTTFACVDKSVFQPKFVDRVTTTTTTTTPPTTTTLPTTRTPATRGRWQEFSTEYWDAEDEAELGVQAKPLEPKPISEEEPAHVIHIDHAEEGVEEAENFAKVKDEVKAF